MKICPKCQAELADDAKSCAICGYTEEETAVAAEPVVEAAAEAAFDHKPLVTEWYESNGFARFMFNVWPKLKLIANLVIAFSVIIGILACFLGLVGNVLNIEGVGGGVIGLGLSLTSFGLGLNAAVYGVDLVFGNRLKKILFASFLKKKNIDLDAAAKYVFDNVSASNFSNVSAKEKGSLSAWLESPLYFGEAVMMAAKPETKKTNLVWMIVLAAVGFVCQSILASGLTTIFGGVFSIDFDAGLLGAAIVALVIGFVLMIAARIAEIIVSNIGTKKMSEAKATWAITVTNPEATEEKVINA